MAPSSPPAAQISYEDLYARWERGNWSATQVDFTQDRPDWRERFSDLERRAALWNYAMFFHGEDAVTDALGAFVDAAPREEQKYFLATQQVDEARHAVFFGRFMREVADLGAGDGVAGALTATRGELTWGFRRVFARLERMVDELRRDPSRPRLAQAVTLYHVLIEGTLAQPGQHYIERYLTQRDLLPGFRAGMRNVSADEQRHIGFGVRMLHDLAAEDPEVPAAVAELLWEMIPPATAVFVPPNWDRRYAECFGFTLEQIFEEGTRSLDAKLRAAGLPLESLPGPPAVPVDLPMVERARRGLALLEAGLTGEKTRPPSRDPEDVALLFDMVRRAVDHRAAPDRPFAVQWDLTDLGPWHLVVDNGSTRGGPGPAPARPDVRISTSWEDFVDVSAGRVDPNLALLRGRMRPRGSPLALWRLRRLLRARG